MKYFVLNQNNQKLAVDDYLKKCDPSADFARFVRREALGEVLSAASDDNPKYLAYANKLGFNWEGHADIGHAQYDYKANLMKRLVESYARQLVHGLDLPVYEVGGGNMFGLQHPVVQAYASLYGDRLYRFRSGKSEVVMSYDASYPQFNLAARSPMSYKQLPLAHFSLADCYRHEQSGEVMLLYRQRRFHMPDIHPYFEDIKQAFEWLPKLQAKIIEAGRAAKRDYQVVVEVPSDGDYRKYASYIEQIPKQLGADVLVNVLNDGQDRYWVVNVDYKIIDALGQSREIGCVQVDIGNAPRLGIEYIDQSGRRKNPVIIHSAIPGGIERYLYMMLDNFESGLPDWVQPVHIRLLPVGAAHVDACRQLVRSLESLPLRLEIDDRDASVASKLKLAHEELVPHKVVIGPEEAGNNFAELHELAAQLAASVAGMPFIKREWPVAISRRL